MNTAKVETDPNLCAVEGCTEEGRPQVCPYDQRYHHHGLIHYGDQYPEMKRTTITFRPLEDGGWRGVCNPHYRTLDKARTEERIRRGDLAAQEGATK